MKNIGDKVQINFITLKTSVNKDVLDDILKWDEKCGGMHTITDISLKNIHTPKQYARYTLDNDYVFLSDELLDIQY